MTSVIFNLEGPSLFAEQFCIFSYFNQRRTLRHYFYINSAINFYNTYNTKTTNKKVWAVRAGGRKNAQHMKNKKNVIT